MFSQGRLIRILVTLLKSQIQCLVNENNSTTSLDCCEQIFKTHVINLELINSIFSYCAFHQDSSLFQTFQLLISIINSSGQLSFRASHIQQRNCFIHLVSSCTCNNLKNKIALKTCTGLLIIIITSKVASTCIPILELAI